MSFYHRWKKDDTCKHCSAKRGSTQSCVEKTTTAAAKTTGRTRGILRPAGTMTVAEAGRKGGGVVRDSYGHKYFVAIGKKGGQKVRDLIVAGKRALAEGRR